MFTLRDFLIFIAGGVMVHLLSHITLAVSGVLPVTVGGVEITPQVNMVAIVLNALITIGLLWWASRLPRCVEYQGDTRVYKA